MRYIPKLSKKTKERLKQAGWSEHRKIDITVIKDTLQKRGFIISSENEQFLSSFMNLELVYPNGECLFEFKVLNYSIKHFEKFYPLIGKEFILIGSIRNYYIDLLLATDNSMFASTDDQVFLIGNNLDEGINFICESSLKSKWELKPL